MEKISFSTAFFQAIVAEITPPQFRGFMGGLYQIGIYFGIFLCLMISPYVSWRLLTAVALGISCIMSCGLIFMKKTCERLMNDNKIPVLEQVLQSLSDSFNGNVSHFYEKRELILTKFSSYRNYCYRKSQRPIMEICFWTKRLLFQPS